MSYILIIADDLTGALDSAVAFSRPNTVVRVVRDVAHLTLDTAKGVDVLCINTNSREGSAAHAERKIREIASKIDFSSIPTIFKKVDSRLKGHVKSETKVLADLSGHFSIIAAPAIPDMGRIQRGGQLIGVGATSGVDVPISMGDKFPDESALPDIFSTVEFDKLITVANETTLWVGARGLAFALARAQYGNTPQLPTSLDGPIWFAIGSRDPISVAQASDLARMHTVLTAPNGNVPAIERTDDITTVQLTAGAEEIPTAQVGSQFSTGICAALRQHKPRTFLACGGETANEILNNLSINTLDVIVEVRAGLPLCHGVAPWGPVNILTKSGGFGAVNLLSLLARMAKSDHNDLPNQESQ